jgi:hypothetical protein
MLAALAAPARSASSQMIIGSEPPSSSVTRLTPGAHKAMTRSPTGVEPVKAIFLTAGWVTSASPVIAPLPAMTLNTPAGSPPSHSSCAKRRVVSGVVFAGLATTVLPATSAGASLLHSRVVGKFQGTIAPTTPSGRRSTYPSIPGSRPGVCTPRRDLDRPA